MNQGFPYVSTRFWTALAFTLGFGPMHRFDLR